MVKNHRISPHFAAFSVNFGKILSNFGRAALNFLKNRRKIVENYRKIVKIAKIPKFSNKNYKKREKPIGFSLLYYPQTARWLPQAFT